MNVDKSSEDNQEPSTSSKFCGFDSVEEFTKNGLKLIIEATKAANALPSGSSRDLYTAYGSYVKAMEAHSDQILNVISNVVKQQGIKGNIVRRDKEDKFVMLQECNDMMMERINSNLDDLSGVKKAGDTILVTEVKQIQLPKKYILAASTDKAKFGSEIHTAKLITAKNIQRPQVNFKTPPDNSNSAFVPRIKDKPNTLKPLAVLPEFDDDGNIISYLHPYEFEIEKFEPPAKQLCKVEPRQPLKIEETPLIYVDNEAKLKEVVNELLNVSEIAVDLEHHSFRTFQGITCLMQISTRSKDYIIDTLPLRDELCLLNEVFTKPTITKVFHGADSDVEWLQKDFSLYLVNMFDTHQAAKRLGLSRLSLAFLLKLYCDIDADKTFQLADWRMRPLPNELIKYAQQDTHYLLYIFDLMTNELLKLGNDQPNILKSVYQSSKEICLKRYVKPIFTDDSYMDLYRKSKRFFDNRQLFAMKEIFAWRDKIARIEDESYGYVMPNHMLMQIAESLPREMQGILACCNPIPPIVRQNLHPLHKIILKAREQPLIKPMIPDQNRPRQSMNVREKKDLINNPLYCPHDLSQCKEIRDDLPTLLGDVNVREDYSNVKLKKLTLSAFDDENNEYGTEKLHVIKFVSPYKRYKLMIPYLEKLKEKELSEKERANKLISSAIEAADSTQKESKKDKEFEDLYKLPLKELKKRKINEAQVPQSPSLPKPISKKRKVETEEATEEVTVKTEAPKVQEVPQLLKLEGPSNADSSETDSSPNKKKWKKKKNKPQKPAEVRQSSNKPVPFDYSQVDYKKKFQGGSSTSQQQQQQNRGFNQKFKGGRGSKTSNKKLNNLFSFSSVRISKK